MERRCVVCGQAPTSTFTYPQNEKQGLKWRNMLGIFVPIDVLMNHCCVCNKHINGSQKKRIEPNFASIRKHFFPEDYKRNTVEYQTDLRSPSGYDNPSGNAAQISSVQVDKSQRKTVDHPAPSTNHSISIRKGSGLSAQAIFKALNQNEPQPNPLHACESLASPCSNAHEQEPPVNVLIMGGSILPSYYNRNLTQKSSDISQICVLERDFTMERAIFPDIDEPNYTICQPYDQNQYYCNENAELTAVLVMGIAPEKQCICNQGIESCMEEKKSENLPVTGLDELECLLAKQQEIQLSIQEKLNQLLANTKKCTTECDPIKND